MLGKSIFFAALLSATSIVAAAQDRQSLGLTPFTFKDTSGEVIDQTAEHDQRLSAFVDRLKQELAGSGKFELAAAACADDQCRPADTLAKARAEGKRYLVFGAIQKTSSLVLWSRVDVVEVQTEKVVITRLITFRGDTDEAWSRTARFIGRAINGGFGA